MNKELCIKVGKWNNSILWCTVEKTSYCNNKCTDRHPLHLFSYTKRPDRLLGLLSLAFNWYGGSFPGSKVAGAWSYLPHLLRMLRQIQLYLYSLVSLHGVERDKFITLPLPISLDFFGDIPSDVTWVSPSHIPVLWKPDILSACQNDTKWPWLPTLKIATQSDYLGQCFWTAGPRPSTGPWHQLYRAARGLMKLQYATRFH